MAQKELQLSENAIRKITEVVISKLETIDGNWQQPWLSQGLMIAPRNLYSAAPLKGMNELLLSMLSEQKGWKTPYFLTFNQIINKSNLYKYKGLELAYTIDDNGKKHFEESFPVIKWVLNYYNPENSPSFIQPKQYDLLSESEKQEWRPIFNKKVFNEFNLEQTNFPRVYPEEFEKLVEECTQKRKDFVHDENYDDKVLNEMIENGNWITNKIHLEGGNAFFRPSTNEIWLPPRETFTDSAKFYGTAMHEMIHSTGPQLGRNLGDGFGSKSYAMEELVAEFGAAVNALQIGIEKTVDAEHLQYIKAWIEAIHEDPAILGHVVNDTMKASNFFLRHYEQVESELQNKNKLPVFVYGDYQSIGDTIKQNTPQISEDLRSKGMCTLKDITLATAPDKRTLVADIKLMGNYNRATPENLRIISGQQITSANQILQDLSKHNLSLLDIPQGTIKDAMMGSTCSYKSSVGNELHFTFQRGTKGYQLNFPKIAANTKQYELDFSASM